jgi:hypothetical protein
MGLLTNLLTAFGPGASAQSPGGVPSGGEGIGTLDTGIATSDTDNPANPATGSPTETPAQSSGVQGFWQQHPVAAQVVNGIFGKPKQPQLPQGSPQAPAVQSQPQQIPQIQPPGNASASNGLSSVTSLMPKAAGGAQSGSTLQTLAPLLME